MTKEAQRIAIAKFCNWTPPFEPATLCGWTRKSDGARMLSDPLTCLETMHEAEKYLPDDSWSDYWDNLCDVTGAEEANGWGKYYTCPKKLLGATASQKAEAFLKTLYLWVDCV